MFPTLPPFTAINNDNDDDNNHHALSSAAASSTASASDSALGAESIVAIECKPTAAFVCDPALRERGYFDANPPDFAVLAAAYPPLAPLLVYPKQQQQQPQRQQQRKQHQQLETETETVNDDSEAEVEADANTDANAESEIEASIGPRLKRPTATTACTNAATP